MRRFDSAPSAWNSLFAPVPVIQSAQRMSAPAPIPSPFTFAPTPAPPKRPKAPRAPLAPIASPQPAAPTTTSSIADASSSLAPNHPELEWPPSDLLEQVQRDGDNPHAGVSGKPPYSYASLCAQVRPRARLRAD